MIAADGDMGSASDYGTQSNTQDVASGCAIGAEGSGTSSRSLPAHCADQLEWLLASAGIFAADVREFAPNTGPAQHKRRMIKNALPGSFFFEGCVRARENNIGSEALDFDRVLTAFGKARVKS